MNRDRPLLFVVKTDIHGFSFVEPELSAQAIGSHQFKPTTGTQN